MVYIEEALNNNILVDQLFYEGFLEQVYIERDFMLSCLENNIILEAEVSKAKDGESWIKKIINSIKAIFNKFIENITNLFNSDKDWIAKNLPNLKNLNFDGLKVNVLPYWNLDTKEITNTLSTLQKEINNMKYGDARLKELQDREAVEQSGAFKKFKPKEGTFTDGIKAYFKVGENNEPKPVTLEGDGLKIVCVNQMTRFVNEFNSTLLPSLKSSQNNLNNILTNIEKELNRKTNVKESFCIIENALYSDTELAFCNNFSLLFEAENNTITNTNEEKKEDKPVLNKVENTSNNNTTNNNDNTDNKSVPNNNVQYYNYLKHVVQLNQIAIAAAITACEERYRAYMSILKGVVAEKGKK